MIKYYSPLCFSLLLAGPLVNPPALQAATGETRVVLKARASEIDSRAKEHPEIHYVFTKDGKPDDVETASVDVAVAPQGRLVIWLMGYNDDLFRHINGYGIHAIQVHYARGWFSTLNREPPPDGQYLGRIRLEAATGKDFSPDIDVPYPDGMMERAHQFLLWLAKNHPEGKWEQFLTEDQSAVRWEKVTMSGASHGSTTSARFAKYQKVDRVVMFSGPRDQLESWQALPSATPPERFFGFTHILDTGWSGDHYCRSWQLLGLHAFGPLVMVDDAKPPYQNTRRLISNAEIGGNTGRAHGASTPGKGSPKDAAGNYLYEPVWDYLFNSPISKTGPSRPYDEDCRMELGGPPIPEKP